MKKLEHKTVFIIDLMKRLGQSGEIVSGFIFLASDDSSFMTGTTL